MSLVHLNFESVYLNGNTDVNIILPDKPRSKTPAQFYGSDRKYKVLWLLHGTFGDYSDWLRKSNIELYACEKDLIVVMPSALNSNYSNWDSCMMGYSAYDFLTEELMPLVYNWFPASDKREDNFISGLSMGGGGAIKFAANHPDKFAGVAVLSAAPRNVDCMIRDNEQIGERARVSIANAGGPEAYANSYENTWRILKERKEAGALLPKMYFAIGKNDFLYDLFSRFRTFAQEIDLGVTFEEFEGYKHEWRFWDMTIQRALEFFGITGNDAGNPF
ncbi:MAG: alpha/beta hydrolase family protein [Eubacteriales bacterium]|nr:alpha/beta hydrolase family protein [Eubacteriales bacterium]